MQILGLFAQKFYEISGQNRPILQHLLGFTTMGFIEPIFGRNSLNFPKKIAPIYDIYLVFLQWVYRTHLWAG